MLLHSRKTRHERALIEEVGRKRNIILVVVGKRQKWGHSSPTGNSSSQSISCGIRTRSEVVQKRTVKKQNQKINRKEEETLRAEQGPLPGEAGAGRQKIPSACLCEDLF